jgi:hypothetical protein
VPAPKGWGKETIALPPMFAPTMKWKGVEELRFAPGMFKADSSSFFSYAILFWLPGEQPVDAEAMERELLLYYQGLSKAVLKGKNQEVDVSAFTLKIQKSPDKPGQRPGGEGYTPFTGELKWTEPFATGKPQTLRLQIQTWYCEKHKHQCIFLCASPQPDTAEVWKTLGEIRAGCKCH